MKFNDKTKQELIDLLQKSEEENSRLRLTIDEIATSKIKSPDSRYNNIDNCETILEDLADKLEKTQNNYKFLIENINDIVYEYDSNGILKYISPVVEKTFGFTADDILGKNFIQYVGGDKEYATKVLDDLRDKKEICTEYQIPTKTGDIRWANLSTKAVFDGDTFMGGAGTVTDVTERKYFELELKRSELLYRSILDASPDPITITDLEGKILLTSKSVVKTFGFESSFDFSNHSILEFIDKQDHEKASNAMMGMFQNEFPGAEEYKGVKADGSTFDIEVNGEFIRDDTNQPMNLIFVTRDITQRKQAEEKLKEVEDLYKNLVENINEIIYEIDKQGIVKYVSPAIQQMGYQPEEMIGKSFLDFAGNKAVVLYSNLVNIKEGEQITNEYEMLAKNGDVHWLRFSTKAIFDQEGHFVGGNGTLVDVTERKQVEVELQRSEALYSSIFNVSPDAMTIINFDGSITFASPANYKIFGYDLSYDLTRHSVFDFVAPEDYDRAIRNSMRKLDGEDIGVVEYKGVRADGSIFEFDINSEFILDVNNNPVQLLLIIRDISNRKLLENKLKRTEENYRQMVERINDVVFEVTSEGLIKYVSPAIERVLGYTSAELIGHNFFDYMYADDIQYLASALKDLLNRDSSDLEYRYYKKDGTVRWVRSSTKPIVEDGNMIGGIGVLIDIHERKLAEESLRLSELRYKTFFEGNTSIMILIDPETGEIKDANPAASLYYGWAKEKICRMNISEINVLTKEEIDAEMQLAKSEKRKHFYFKHLLANGEIHDVEVYSGPIVFGDSTLLYSIVHDITERVQIENALRLSEEKYRSIFETVQDAYYEASVDGILLDISPAIENMTKGQLTRNELIGKSLVQFYVNPNARDLFYLELFKNDVVNDYEIALQNKDGSVIPIAITSTLVRDVNGIPQKITGSMRDISERKLAEKEIKESEEKYRLLFSNNPQPMWIYDLETLAILEVNQSSMEQYGYTRDEFLQMTIKDVRPVEDIPDLLDDVQKATKNESLKGVWRHVWKNGEMRYVEISAQSVNFNGRKARHVLINDITNRILTENEIKDKSTLLTNLIINLKEGILLEDSDRKIVLTNQLFCDMFDIPVSPDMMVGADCTNSAEQSKLLFKDPDKFLSEINQVHANRIAVFNDELELADGRHFERDYIPTYLDNKYSGHLWKYRDITERKMAEQALKNSDERFNQVVAQSQEVVWEVDVQGLYTYVSPMAIDVYGYSPNELIGKLHFYDICPIKERDMLMQVAFDIFGRKEDIRNLVNKVVRPDFTEIIILTNGIPIINDQGDLIGYRGIDANITEQKRAEEELIKFRTISDQANYGAFIASLDGTFIYVNDCMAKMVGWQAADLIGKNVQLLQSEEHLSRLGEIGHLIRTHGGFVSEELYYTRKDGTSFPSLMTAKVVSDNNQDAQFVSSTLIDITERKLSEENLIKANRLRSVISGINHAIVTEKSKQKLLEKVCNIIIVSGEFQMAWIGVIDEYSRIVKPYISDGVVDGYLSTATEISVDDVAEGRGPTGTAIREGRPFICNDIENEPIMSIWKDKALTRNYRSSIALPLVQFGEIFGALTIYSSKSNFFNAEEVALLVEVVDNISNALEAIETENERKHAEEELRKLSRAMEQSPVSIVITNLDGNIEYANPKACESTGYLLQELIGQNPRVLQSGETSKVEYTNLWDSITSGQAWHGLFHNKKKTGELYWESSTVAPIIGKDGEITHYVALKEDITLRKKMEEDLIRSESALNYAQSIAKMGSWEVDYLTGKTTWSKNLYQLYEIDTYMDDIPMDYFRDMVHPDDLGLFESTLNEISESKTSLSFDLRLILPNGKTKWIQNNVVPVLENNHIIGLNGVNVDVTDKKQKDDQLRAQNERLNAIMQAMPDLIFLIDKFGTYLEYFASDTAKELLQTNNNFVGSTVIEQFNEETAELHLRNICECVEKQKLMTYDYDMLVEGAIVNFEARIVPLGLDRVLAFVRDITSKKRADLEIKKLYHAVEQSPILVVITDLDAKIEYVNTVFTTVTGYSAGEVIGKSTSILKSGKTDKQVYDDLWNTISIGNEWHCEWINKKKNGELYWENVSITPIHDESGCITNYVAIKQDITERKKTEQEIRDLNENLEMKIQQRTEQLADMNRDLLHEIEERKRLDEALVASEQSYQTVVENVTEIIFQTDNDGLWLFLNKAWEEVTGFTIDEAVGQLFLNYVHPDDRQRNLDLFAPLINREKDSCRHEVRYLTKDGGFRWIEVFARLGINDKGEITGTYGTLQDITERKRAEDFELEMLQLSSQLTGISFTEIDSALNLALLRIGNFLNADRAYIFEIADSKAFMSNTFEWCNEKINPEINNLQNIPVDILPMWMEDLNQHKNIIIPSVKDLPESWHAEREILEPQGIQSLIVIPMLVEDTLLGFVGLDSVQIKRQYTSAEINILKVWSSMLSSLINNKRTESLLEQTRQNFETFFNTIDDFLWVLDESGNIIHINNTVMNRLGYSAEELETKSILMVHPDERRDEAARIVGEMLQGIADFCPVPVVTRKGVVIPVETRVKHGLWNGKSAVFGVSKDISKIQLSEQKFSTAFQSNSALMAISTFKDGQYLDVNNTFLETLGYSRDEVLGKTNMEMGFFPDKNLRTEIIGNLKDNRPVRKLEAIICRKDGEMRTILLSADTIFLGEKKCLLTVSVDITERKVAEEEIRKARSEAEKANVAKSEFLSRMSHELRTPMNSILGFAQILEMGELSTGQKKGVNHILRSGKHLLSLINEVLDISRIEAGRLSISIEPIKVSNILEEMIDVLRPMAADNDVSMQLQSTVDSQIFVSFDRQSLKQVMLNLLNNAIKYNKPGGSVLISMQQLPETIEHKHFVRISISDTGIGISSEDIPKLFTPFERIGANKTSIEGTGLGLAVVKKLIDAMGGYIVVESIPDKGSTFSIDLPKADNQLNILHGLEVLTDTGSNKVEKKGTVLYIEDNTSNVELVEQILLIQRPEIQLISNMSGKQAVKLATEYKPDLILLDLNLPDIHGSEVLKLLLDNELTKNIPVVVISADAMHKQIEKVINAGAKTYLTKPLEVVGFLRIIDEYIQG